MDVRVKKIFVGLSGGVDSAVSAALLKEQGAEVTAVFIKGWYPPGMPCTWADDRRDAMRVAARLRIPFRTLDASAAYKESVIEYLLAEYKAGRTPNPDVMCNRHIKFGAFYRYARAQGAHAIATGHYRAGEKDQSYFLWAVPRDILMATIFPVGDMKKEDVRRLAERYDLPVAHKRDSQGICFLGNISVEEFLLERFGTDPGSVIDLDGRVIGTHNGALLHTIGERLALPGSASGPWFVVAKDVALNRLTVSSRLTRTPANLQSVFFTEANWIGDPLEATSAQMRYRGPTSEGRVAGDRFRPAHATSELPVPGQSIVFYRDRELLGGGIITA